MRQLTRKYIAILAGVAICILAVGYVFRPRKTQPPPPSEGASMPLQKLSRDAEMQATTDFLTERIQYAAPFVFYLHDLQATGIAWNTRSTLITTDNLDAASQSPATLSLLAIKDPQQRQLAPVGVASHLGEVTEWAALVARRGDGHLIWTPGFAGGRSLTSCSGIDYHEVAFSSPITRAFAGGGLFDLNGNLLGVVVRCGNRLSLVSADEIDTVLKQNEALESKLLQRYGIRLRALDAAAKEYFHVDSGLLITEVWAGALGAQAGLQAGDIVTMLNGQPVESVSDLSLLSDPASANDARLTVRSGKTRTDVTLNQPGAVAALQERTGEDFGIQLEAAPRGVAVANVSTTSPAFQAGLRPGDRVVQIGPLKNPTREALEKALAHAGSTPVFLVFDRGAMERGILLP